MVENNTGENTKLRKREIYYSIYYDIFITLPIYHDIFIIGLNKKENIIPVKTVQYHYVLCVSLQKKHLLNSCAFRQF